MKHSHLIAICLLLTTPLYAGAPYGEPNQPYDKLPGTLETYHVKWATPLPGGKLKVLFILPYINSREVVELRQRLDLEYTVIMNAGRSSWGEGYREGGSASPLDNPELVLNKLAKERLDLQRQYDAIIIGKVSWEVIPREFRDLIIEHVRRGTALVYVSPNRAAAAWNADKPEVTTEDAQYGSLFSRNLAPQLAGEINTSLPLDMLPLKPVSDRTDFTNLPPVPMVTPNVPAQQAISLRVSEVGKGRAVVLDYFDNRGSYNSLTPLVDYNRVMYDYAYALLAKCVLWGVAGEPKVHATLSFPVPARPAALSTGWEVKTPCVVIDRDLLGQTKVAVGAVTTSELHDPVSLDFSLRDSQGVPLSGPLKVPEVKAPATREIPLPVLPRGVYFADLRVLDSKGAVLDFCSKAFRVETSQQVTKIETDKDRYEKGEKIQGKATFSQPLTASQKAQAEAIDTWGRIVFRTPVALASDRQSGSFAIPVQLPLCRLWDLRVSVRDPKGEVDSSKVWIGLPNWSFDEYFWPLIFSTTPDHDWKGYLYTEQARKYGINGANVYLIYAYTDLYEKYERAHLQSISYAEHIGENGLGTGLQYGSQGKFDKEYTGPALAELSRMIRTYADTGQPIDTVKYPEAMDMGAWELTGGWINSRMKDYKESLKFGSPYYFLTGENYLSGEFTSMENSGFSPYCTKLFQDWCREEYKGDLNALNAEWGSDLKSWEEVRGILIKEAVEKNQLPRWVAFRYFMRSKIWSQFFMDWTDMMRKALGRDVLTGTNGHDHHDFSRYRGHMTSGKLYVGQEMNSEWRTCVGEELRQSFSGDKSFLIAAQSQMMLNWDFQTPLNNHRLPWRMLFAGYRGFDWEQGLAQPSMGGMSCFTPDYSEPTDYFKNISEEVRYLQRGIGKLCNTSKPLRSPVAILWSPINHYISRLLPFQEQGFTGTWLYNLSVDGGAIGDALVLMKTLRLRPTFIAPEDLVDDALAKRGFKALLLPYNKGMSEDEAKSIRSFVQGGGLVIADNEPGSYSRFGKPLQQGLLADLFPVTDKENIVKVGKGVAAYMPNTINGYLGRFEKCDYAGSDSVALLLEKYAGVRTPIELIDGKGKPRRDTLMPIYLKGSTRLFGLLRADTSAGKETEETTVKLERKYYVWNVREGKPLGLVESFKVNLDMYPKFFALLPANPAGIKLNLKKSTVMQGERVELDGEIAFADGPAAEIAKSGQVVHIEVSDPKGRELGHYRDNVLFSGSAFKVVLPVSFTEQPGQYTISVEHPITGARSQTKFKVEGP